jgi:type IV pilus assembly protein PilQ
MRHNSTFREAAGRKGANPTTGYGSGAWAGLSVALAACMVVAAFAAVEPVRPRARLNSIVAKASAHGASVVLEASEPVAYVTSRPDPLTVLVDLRNATTAGVSNQAATSPAGPIAAVTVQDATGADGSAVARIRVLLAAPSQHTVHSDRNLIEVDVVPDDDVSSSVRPSAAPAPAAVATRSAADPVTPPATPEKSTAPPAPGDSTDAGQSGGPSQVQAQQATGNQCRYSGHPVSLDFQGADLRSVLRTFSEISGFNIVIDPAVNGTVDVALRDVPSDQALESILRANKLGCAIDGMIFRVAPLTVLAEEATSRTKLAEAQAMSGDLKVVTKTLNYALAEDLAPVLKGNALSNRGSTAVDRRTNTIIINDLPAYLAKAEALLNSLDQSEGQVEIEARIVSTTKTFARQLGVTWGFTGQATPELNNTTGAKFPATIIGNVAVNPSGSTAQLPNNASLQLGTLSGGINLNAALQALENEGRIKVLLQPRVVTQNNVKARITRGQEIPYTTTIAPPEAGGTGVVVQQPMPTVQFKTAALTLEVTPRITPSDTVMLQVDVDNGSPGEVQANGNVAINTQRAQTTVLVQNGATTVIGGIYGTTENRTDYRTPGLGRIPLLRWLFKSQTIGDSNEELLIFITPRVMRVK